MSSESPSFFSDPKVILALFALIVSIGSLICTLANQWEQNRRWDALNVGMVELKETKFFTWRELTRDEAFSTNWGYDPLILGSPEAWGKFRLVYFLQLRDPTTGTPIPKANPVFSLAEVETEVRRLGISQPVAVFRAFRPVFVFENIGKSEVTDCRIRIDMRLPSNDWQTAFESNTAVRIPPAQSVNVSFDFAIPLEQAIPNELSFKINVQFKNIHGQLRSREIVASWESQRDYWFYGKADRSH